jgi:lipopolysaccharide transport system permease protein
MQPGRITTIEAGKTMGGFCGEIYRYRDLFYIFAWRDFKVRYKQTLIGAAWAFLQPLLTMAILTIAFGKLAKLPSGGVPYFILVFVALLPWYFFSSTLVGGSNSIVSNAGMISKIYFPRAILPVSTVLVNLVDFLISFFILFILMLLFYQLPDIRVLWIPFFLALTAITAIGLGLWFAALNVRYRDFRYVVPFVIQMGLYISPVGFDSSIIPEQWRLVYSLNPMVGAIDGFRWALLGRPDSLYMPGFLVSIGVAIVVFVSGTWFFHKSEREFADVI